MKRYLLAACVFTVAPFLFAQGEANRALPSDPKALLEVAAPYYDYASPDMKPWHIRYHYKFYDGSGALSSEAEFDYSWSTSKMSRASWTHNSQSTTEWRTAEDKELRSVTGNDFDSLEHLLYSALLPSFPTMENPQSGDRQLKYFTSAYSSIQLACVGLVKTSSTDTKVVSLATAWPSYCFYSPAAALLASHLNGTITNSYGQIQKFQNHYFAGQIVISYAGEKRVEATLEELNEVGADDAAFTPSPNATEFVPSTNTVTVPVIRQLQPLVLLYRVDPNYPPAARALHITGIVVIEATIGKDGRVIDAKIASSPNDSLSHAALDAVQQWRYAPYIVNGEPMEIHTRINVGFKP